MNGRILSVPRQEKCRQFLSNQAQPNQDRFSTTLPGCTAFVQAGQSVLNPRLHAVEPGRRPMATFMTKACPVTWLRPPRLEKAADRNRNPDRTQDGLVHRGRLGREPRERPRAGYDSGLSISDWRPISRKVRCNARSKDPCEGSGGDSSTGLGWTTHAMGWGR